MHSLSLSKPGNPELFTVRSPLAPGRRCDLAFWTPLPRRLSLPPQSLPPLWRLWRRPLRVPGCSPSAELSAEEKEWLKKLPDKKKPLYSHSLPCIEAWLKSLDFYQSSEDMAVWFVEKPDWHAQLSLDITDLFIRKCTA